MVATVQPALIGLVADDPEWRNTLRTALEQEGFQVRHQRVPRTLQELLGSSSAVDPAVLLVINLPNQRFDLPSALRFIEQLRRQDRARLLLLLADDARESERVDLLEAGADDVLVCPFGLRELVARCRALLRGLRRGQRGGRSTSEPSVLESGAIRLYREECRVVLDDAEVVLTPREFRLLECFMLRPGRVLSRAQLLELVWGPDYSGKTKSVDVHVWWLRHKLDRPGCASAFVTVRGVGYRFVPEAPTY
ncbi:MAG: winged helix-turn-helix transcriptional regulator [Vulcanococcus sp.]